MMRAISVDIFLALAFLSALFSIAGMLIIQDFYERLHLMTPAATIGIWCLTLAILIHEGFSQGGLKACACALLIFVMNPILTHATARAARIHQHGQWQPEKDEKVPVVGTDHEFFVKHS